MHLRGRHYLLIDLLLTVSTFYLSFLVRFDFVAFEDYYSRYAIFAFILLAIRLPLYLAFGLYSRLWRYASVSEMVLIALAVTLGSAIALVFALWLTSPLGFHLFPAGFPRSIIAIDWLLSLAAVGGVRFLPRALSETGWAGRSRRRGQAFQARKSALIVGAGDAGAMLAREMLRSRKTHLVPMGFVDDDPQKVHHQIHGVPVLGRRSDLAQIAARYDIDEVIIAMPTAPGRVVRETLDLCRAAGLPAKTIPGVYELLDRSVRIQSVREVQLDDLLRREPSANGLKEGGAYLAGRRVLVTGAGGSIGAELCRQIAHYGPSALSLLGHGENSIFDIHAELSARYPRLRLEPLIADVRDPDRLTAIFARHSPEVVFHAAAHKHVTLMELNPVEAVTNNVLGTARLLSACEAHGVERFVLVSTDKAVHPANAMGATKRLAELLVVEMARRIGRPYVAVRFGNVLGSRGSVLPIFQRQIAAGGPVTVTHPEMKRFFMTIPEAVHLIIRAGSIGEGGEVFVLNMGEQIRIADLARELIRLYGLEVGRDIDLVFTGRRPGEKLEEELFLQAEEYQATADESAFVARATGQPSTNVWSRLPELEACARAGNTQSMLDLICGLLPVSERAAANGFH